MAFVRTCIQKRLKSVGTWGILVKTGAVAYPEAVAPSEMARRLRIIYSMDTLKEDVLAVALFHSEQLGIPLQSPCQFPMEHAVADDNYFKGIAERLLQAGQKIFELLLCHLFCLRAIKRMESVLAKERTESFGTIGLLYPDIQCGNRSTDHSLLLPPK